MRIITYTFAHNMMKKDEIRKEILLVAALRMDSHEAFSYLFNQYYANLCLYAGRFIHDRSTCEDIVQEAFTKLWNNRKAINVDCPVRPYLIKLVQNLAIDVLRQSKIHDNYTTSLHEEILSLSPEDHMFFSEVMDAYETALSQLDSQVRQTLLMSIDSRLKHKEIASQLNISVRTVEARIAKAMMHIRKNLQKFSSITILFLINKALEI